MKIFIGFDVSLTSTAICVLNGHGKVLKEAKVETEPGTVIGFTVANVGERKNPVLRRGRERDILILE